MQSSRSSRSLYSAPFFNKDASCVRQCTNSHAVRCHRRPLEAAFRLDHFSAKITSAGSETDTGLPSSVAGLNFQRFFTIVQAASSRRGLPLVVVTAHSLTVPSVPMVYLIATLPCSCKRIDTGG